MCGDTQSSLSKTHIYYDALISEYSFPKMDASSHDTVLEKIRIVPVPPKLTVPPNAQTIQKTWLPSNFRIKIDGFDEPCQKVNKIESTVVREKSGRVTEIETVPGAATFGGRSVTRSLVGESSIVASESPPASTVSPTRKLRPVNVKVRLGVPCSTCVGLTADMTGQEEV